MTQKKLKLNKNKSGNKKENKLAHQKQEKMNRNQRNNKNRLNEK